MIPGDMYEWSGGIFAKKTKFHDAGGPGTMVSPYDSIDLCHHNPKQYFLADCFDHVLKDNILTTKETKK